MALTRYRDRLLFGVVLLYVLAVHLKMLYVFPDPFFFPDSGTYLSAVLSALHGGPFHIPDIRSAGYPVFLVGILGLCHSFPVLCAIQHALAILAGGLSAWIYREYFDGSNLGATLLFALVALWPTTLFYCHSMLTEILFVFLSVLALAAWMAARRGSLWGWGAAGFFLGLASAVRPTGIAWLSAFFLWFIYEGVRNGSQRHSKALKTAVGYFALGSVSVLAIASIQSRIARGFWGLDRIAQAAAFGHTFPFLDLQDISDLRLRTALEPLIRRDGKGPLADDNWIRFSAQGPGATLRRVYVNEAEAESALRRLNRAVWTRHLIPYAINRLHAMGTLFIDMPLWNGAPTPLLDFVAYSFRNARDTTQPFPSSRLWFAYRPSDGVKYFSRIETTPVYPLEKAIGWQKILEILRVLRFGLVPLAGLGLLLAWRDPVYRSGAVLAVLIILLHAAATVVGADSDPRHFFPLTPIFLMGAVWGCEKLIRNYRGL
jgi:hypothetical protein